MCHSRQHDVVDVPALSREESLVLDASHCLPDTKLGHAFSQSNALVMLHKKSAFVSFVPAVVRAGMEIRNGAWAVSHDH